MSSGASVCISHLSKTYPNGTRALNDICIDVAAGEMVALIGASGSGKSTLLRHLSGFIAGDRGKGEIVVGDSRAQADGRIAADIRRQRAKMGFVFQQFNLVGQLSVRTNVMTGLLPRVPLWRSLTMRFTEAEERAVAEALVAVGIGRLLHQRASTLSGGQQQRVAIARALVQGAQVILADEPIASLDPESARVVMEILRRINREHGITVLVSLHQVDFARRYCARTVALRHGEVVFDGASDQLSDDLLTKLYGVAVDEIRETAIPATELPDGAPLAIAAA